MPDSTTNSVTCIKVDPPFKESAPSRRASIVATYEIESPLPLDDAADQLCGEASSGSFTSLPLETADLMTRHRASVVSLEQRGTREGPSIPSERFGDAPVNFGQLRMSVPFDNVGASIPNVLATIAGNIFEMSAITALRLVDVELPKEFSDRYAGPRFGVEGTRDRMGVHSGVLIGSIIKPSVGLAVEDHRLLVRELIDAGVDFIKDDELVADPPYSPFDERLRVVMEEVERGAQRHQKRVMYAFNITDDLDPMLRKYDAVVAAGGDCVMVTMNAVGLVAIDKLAQRADLPIHGHRATLAPSMRHPLLGVDYSVYQQLARLCGVDHLHVSGLRSKFYESDDQVLLNYRAVAAPIFGACRALPVVSSAQWAGSVPDTARLMDTEDLMMLAGAGIHAHPAGVTAGVQSIRDAWRAVDEGKSLPEYALQSIPLRQALQKFGGR